MLSYAISKNHTAKTRPPLHATWRTASNDPVFFICVMFLVSWFLVPWIYNGSVFILLLIFVIHEFQQLCVSIWASLVRQTCIIVRFRAKDEDIDDGTDKTG